MNKLKHTLEFRIARGLAVGVYALIVLATLLAYWDRMAGTIPEKILSFTLLLSVAYLFVAMVWAMIVAEKGYTDSAVAQASASNEKLVVLGGGVLGVAIVLLPVLKVFEGAGGNKVLLLQGFWQIAPVGAIAILLLLVNETALKRGLDEVKEEAVSAAARWPTLVPLAVLSALWVTAMVKAMILYGMQDGDSLALKIFLEVIVFVYVCAVCVAAGLIHRVFVRPREGSSA